MDPTGSAAATVWLLDVDGVLNAVTTSPDESVWPAWRHGYATANGRSWPITWSPDLVNRITSIHGSGAAEIRWLTTWEDAAQDSLAALLGLPAFRLAGRAADAGEAGGPHGFLARRFLDPAAATWWKLAVARLLLDSRPARPLVWTDDDLAVEPEARAWAERRPAPTLLVSPATDTGLAPEHVSAIEEFCRRFG